MEYNYYNPLQKDSDLERRAFYKNALSEYLLFFNLTVEDLEKYDKIIDLPSDASSFVAELSKNIKNSKKKLFGVIHYLIKV